MRILTTTLLAAALCLSASAAYAAGLGRLTVFSALGQPLNAEIEVVSLQPGEEDGLSARLPSGEAFQQAGIEPSAALNGLRFAIERRGGKPVIRLTTSQPVNEPFLDLLVELQWNNGRLVREYTFLLDPPNYKGPEIAAAPAKPAAAPAAKPLPPLQTGTEPKPEATVEPQPQAAASQAETHEAKEAAPSSTDAAKAQESAKTYEVKRGDTLGAIARENLAPGVSLNQMLVALYRANQGAFLRENLNLVRSGQILSIPSPESAAALEPEEVSRLVQSHRTQFEDYRARLAAAPAPAQAASGEQAVSGKIEAKSDVTPPAATQDQVRLSRADPANSGGVQASAARGDDAAARERALSEAQSRIEDLERNVADLQKLLELKNQQLAELERKAAAAKPPAVPNAAEAPKPAASAAPQSAAAPGAAAPLATAASTAAPQSSAGNAAPEAKKAEPPIEAKKADTAPKPKPKAAPPPPPPPPSLLDEFLENPVALAGLVLILLLLVGYALWAWRRKKIAQAKFQEGVFGAAAGEADAASAAAAAAGAAALAGGAAAEAGAKPAAAEGDEVDPIAEADVYMAYGRDAQAEEILKEALAKDGARIAVHAKLLEIFARRHDTSAFEETALKLKNLTNGSGAEWDKAAALGRSIDPGNSIYGGGEGAAPLAPAAAVVTAAPVLDFDVSGSTADSTASGAPDLALDIPDKADSSTTTVVDFDVGAATLPVGTKRNDFTPGGTLIMDKKEPEATLNGLDFDLSLSAALEEKLPPPPAAEAPEQAADAQSEGLDFDLNLDLGAPTEKSAGGERPAAPLDLSAISLDLGSAGEPAGVDASSNDPGWQEVATKLDLAKAYEEMGDKDGARELLNEVMKDGDAAQKGQAEQLLAKLG